MKFQLLYGQEAIDFVTNSHGPEIRVKEGGSPIAFNAEVDLMDLPANAPNWRKRHARRWNPVLRNDDAFVANSVLDKREWARLDAAIFEMVKLRQNAMADLISRGLTVPGSLATLMSQWRHATERVRPTVSMDGRSRVDRDRTDRLTRSVPIPIFRTDYEIGRRELLASQTLGNPIDTFEAGEAAGSITEEQERMLFSGETGVVVQGSSIAGYTTLAARDTGTAAAYGGGDFATISNIKPTFLGMLAALAAKRYHGPFLCYIAQAQYHQMLDTYSDGSGDTALDRVQELPQIDAVKPSDFLAAGNLVMVQMTSNVVDWFNAMDVQNREWESGDGQALHYAVMAAGAPRLKTDSAGNAGIAHATSC